MTHDARRSRHDVAFAALVGCGSAALCLGDFNVGSATSEPAYFTQCGSSRVVFKLYTPSLGREPWISDGTPGGTFNLVDIDAGVNGSEPSDFLSVGARTFFVATHPTLGRELWVTDGTSAGTRILDVVTGGTGSSPRNLVHMQNGTVLFVASENAVGLQVWRSDGTPAGTTRVGLISSSGAHVPRDLVTVGNRGFFTVDDGVHGWELWTTDGASVSLVRDLYPGPAWGVASGTLRARPSVGDVVFAASDGNDGLQLFVSDGTAAGTRQLGKIGPWAGSGAAQIEMFQEDAPLTWFACDDGLSGLEPWTVRSNGTIGSVSTFGVGCPGTGGRAPVISAQGRPQLGSSTFGFHLLNGAATSLALLNLSTSAIDVPLSGCRLYVGPLFTSLPGVPTSATGSAFVPLPIPNIASYAGVTLYGQWLVIDGNGALFGLATLSNALAALLGN
jgi:ELWxxDGT repeat protein